MAGLQQILNARARMERVKELLLLGWENKDIAEKLGMHIRTLKGNFNWMYKEYGITTGCKRVKLAVMLYRASIAAQSSQGLDAGDTTPILTKD